MLAHTWGISITPPPTTEGNTMEEGPKGRKNQSVGRVEKKQCSLDTTGLLLCGCLQRTGCHNISLSTSQHEWGRGTWAHTPSWGTTHSWWLLWEGESRFKCVWSLVVDHAVIRGWHHNHENTDWINVIGWDIKEDIKLLGWAGSGYRRVRGEQEGISMLVYV